MGYPDRIYALGGAGKEIALTILEQEWVLEDILRPRPNPERLTITILDSAGGEENTDRKRIEEIRTNVNELENELRDSEVGRTGTVDLEYKLITENIQLSSSNDLLGDQTISYITSGTGMENDDWWLKDSHINENLDFARGVVRKRGLGKALYFKSYAEDDELSSVIDLPEKGKVAMLVGLGGGTGSGLMVDISHHIRETMPTAEITLFGVLPNHIEGIEENANAYAALSELEYLSLTDKDLFKDLILLPIDPTDFGGKAGQRIKSREAIEELDESLVYLLLSYYHTDEAGLEDPFKGSPSYSPFTIGIPQVLRYNVEAINEARESIRKIFDLKQEALDSEAEIYAKINRYIERTYDNLSEAELNDQDETDLTERVEIIESLLNLDLLKELDYQSRSIFLEILEDAESESESIEEKIDVMDAQIRALDISAKIDGNFRGDLDEMLPDVLEKEILLLRERMEIMKKKKSIQNNRVQDTIQYLLSPQNDELPGMKLTQLETNLENATERKEGLQEEHNQIEEELENLLEQQEHEIQQKVDTWNRNAKDSLDQLDRFSDLPVESKLRDLQARLEQFNDNIVNAQDKEAVDNTSEKPVLDLLDELESHLNSLGISTEDERARIESSMGELKRAKIALLEMTQDAKWWERFIPWGRPTKKMGEEAHKEYRMVKNQLDNKGIFSIGAPSSTFSSEVSFGIVPLENEYQSREETLHQNIVTALQDITDNPSPELIDDLTYELKHGADRETLEKIVRLAIEDEVSGAEEVREQKSEIENELEEVNEQIDIFEATLNLFDNLSHATTNYSESMSNFDSNFQEYIEESRGPVATEKDKYAYIKNIQPKDTFRATGKENLVESDLFSSEQESQRLLTNLEELAKNTRKQRYNGLRRRKFSKGRTRYGEIKVRVGFSSPAIEQVDPEILDFKDIFSEAFDLGAAGKRIQNPFTDWKGDFGGDWDIGLTVFIDGIFLDNIRKFVQADGYRSCYQRRESELGPDILIHHSFGLEEGHYIRRKSILNLENDEDIEFYLQAKDSDIENGLLQRHLDVVDIDSPTPIQSGYSDEEIIDMDE